MPESAVHAPARHDVTLSNGLRFVGENLARSQGVAIALRFPGGSKDDPADKLGLAGLATDTLFKGTKKRNARALSDAFDFYGIRHGAQTGIESTAISMRFLPEHQSKALALLREILNEPAFPEKEIATARIQAVQELKHLDDEPMSKAFVNVKELYFGMRWGHSELGHEETVRTITRQDALNFWSTHLRAPGAIISVAGKFDSDALLKDLEKLFAHKTKSAPPPLEEPPAPPAKNISKHIRKDSEQTQIAFAFPGVPRSHPDYFALQTGIGVLSGGMSGRLFTEVREKRALVYSVGAQASSLRRTGICFAYAGTTAKRAAETLKVLRAELKRLPTDVTEEEVERAKIGFKSHLLMDQESTSSRARELLDDIYFHDRVIPIEELIATIDAVKVSHVKAYWESHPLDPHVLVTLGKVPLE